MSPSTEAGFDIIIAGLGPVGSVAAIMFSHAGLNVAVVEKDREVYRLPRAVNLDGELVRQFQPLGLAESVNALLQAAREGERAGFANSRREWLFGQDAVTFGSNGWQVINMFDQPELETFLREQALQSPRVTAWVGHSVTGFLQTSDRVEVTLSSGETINGSYLLGCDGASSFVRKTLGIGWQDLGYNRDWLVVDVTMTAPHELPSEVLQVCDPDRIHTYIPTKDPYRRWEFKLNDGETGEAMLNEENIHRLLDAWTPRDTYEIRRAAVYQFHAATAEQWRMGRVLIAGDAAHQTPPFLGQGMNAGFRDIVNLSWKLKLIMDGEAHESLLDTYYDERSAHAHDLVDWAVAVGQLMEHLAATEKAEREGNVAPPPPENVQSAGYGQGRDQPPLRAGVIVTEQVSNTGLTGYLLRQPRVTDSNGTTCLLDERLGPGFSIIGKNAGALGIAARHADLVKRLDMQFVDLSGLSPVQGHLDRQLENVDAAIIRPDRIVYGHTDEEHSLDSLLERLEEHLCLNSVSPR